MMHDLLERPPYKPGPVPGFSLVKRERLELSISGSYTRARIFVRRE